MKVYLDNAATTRMHPKVLEKMLPYLQDNFGNPSSIHYYGRKVRVAVEDAREFIADFINAIPSEIYFTSGGTESNNFIINGISKTEFNESGKEKIITSQSEHHAVLDTIEHLQNEGFNCSFIRNDSNGKVDTNSLMAAIDNSTSFISLIHVNNETGAVNDIKKIAGQVKPFNVYIHSDCVQSFCKVPIDVKSTGIDALTASGHKIYGPKGTGFAYVKSGTPLSPFIFGGSQERNRRGGTENVAGIIGLAEAVKIAKSEMNDNLKEVIKLRDRFLNGLNKINDDTFEINGAGTSSPYIVSVTFKNEFYKTDAEAMLMFLDINGVAASSGAACTSGTLKPSHVILALNKSVEDASGTLRFSFSPKNTNYEIDYALEVIEKMKNKFRKN
ncbi:MAG: cysteine desulfurase [Melioribacteraceae bacterium]|nr:cysteine desulfurase [Melioribacteraceae bacterium]MCF8355385.1 cysteine desulfurase [Melioribacteraceae bacterium]MCF8394630.1 cysteine desulfurase [Melioribacteraceae bacterium]MCF8419627.1 cysteine desulfurase [Melioribacteraceae bacterium]